jgi:LAS superfamily LD-carboxypeptidase LdcB
MAYVVKKVVLPLDLLWQPNGELPTNLLYPVVGGGRLHGLACWWFTVMRNDMWAQTGIELTYTGTYRSLSQQTILFLQRYTTTPIAGSKSIKYWKGKRYYLRLGMAMAAVPGTSNHGLGVGIDLAIGGWGTNAKPLNAAALRWLVANADRYGFTWEVQSEAWHLNYYRGS